MTGHPYFSGPLPRVLAHRGLHTQFPENTLSAFAAAVAAGATHLETDVRGSVDGEAVVFHDEDLRRVAGLELRVSEVSARRLSTLDLGRGEGAPCLSELLEAFPDARFNIDVKDGAALAPTVSAIRNARAEGRVLVTSFSAQRQRAVAAALPDCATSPGSDRVVAGVLAAQHRRYDLVRRIFANVDAIQIPPRSHGLKFLSRRVIDGFLATGCELHVWTINKPENARRLFAAGIHGVVTDRVDLILPVARGTE